jgi:hypothetical protein
LIAITRKRRLASEGLVYGRCSSSESLSSFGLRREQAEWGYSRGKISEIGDFLKVAGEELKTDPFMYLANRYTLPLQSEIDALTNQLAELEETVERLKQKAIDYGISL